MVRKVASLVFLALLLIGVATFFTDDMIRNATPPSSEDWNDSPSLGIEEQKILDQSFTYLDEGGQSYVFLSQDERYVLKLLKYHRLTPNWMIQALPDWGILCDYKSSHIAKRKKKLEAVIRGHQIAFEHLKEESRLLHVQIKPTKDKRMVTLVDQKGISRDVNLGEISFILQEKGDMLSTVFSRHLEAGEKEQVAEHINHVIDLYLAEYRKGIVDLDHGVMHNIGIARGKPFHLDVGKLVRDDSVKNPEIYLKDLTKVVQKIQEWTEKNYPEAVSEINAKEQRPL